MSEIKWDFLGKKIKSNQQSNPIRDRTALLAVNLFKKSISKKMTLENHIVEAGRSQGPDFFCGSSYTAS